MFWPPVVSHSFPCVGGDGMCVVEQHDAIVVSSRLRQSLSVYHMATGQLLRQFGSRGSEVGQFAFHSGGVCSTHRGTVLVADTYSHRIQEVTLDGGLVRSVCSGEVDKPDRYSTVHDGVRVGVSFDGDTAGVMTMVVVELASLLAMMLMMMAMMNIVGIPMRLLVAVMLPMAEHELSSRVNGCNDA